MSQTCTPKHTNGRARPLRHRGGQGAGQAAGPPARPAAEVGPARAQGPKSDQLAPRVLALVAQGRSYRLVGREVGLSKNTVARS